MYNTHTPSSPRRIKCNPPPPHVVVSNQIKNKQKTGSENRTIKCAAVSNQSKCNLLHVCTRAPRVRDLGFRRALQCVRIKYIVMYTSGEIKKLKRIIREERQ